jgi:hypothetical protein
MTTSCQPASHGSSVPSADIDALGLLGAIIGELGEIAVSMAVNIESSDTIDSIVALTEALRTATKSLQQATDKLLDQSGAA